MVRIPSGTEVTRGCFEKDVGQGDEPGIAGRDDRQPREDPRQNRRRPPAGDAAKTAGEKSVRGTDKTVPMAPAPRSRVPDHPTDPHAIDQRDQFVGTDTLREPDREGRSAPQRRGKRGRR
jgi:hypothetical protein